jgi:hypothetical protein
MGTYEGGQILFSKEREEEWKDNNKIPSCYKLYGGQVYVLQRTVTIYTLSPNISVTVSLISYTRSRMKSAVEGYSIVLTETFLLREGNRYLVSPSLSQANTSQ